MKKLTILYLFSCFCCTYAGGTGILQEEMQQKTPLTITGVVEDEQGEAVIGATITLKKRTGEGTITDAEGRFTIKASLGDILLVTFLGYESREIAVQSKSPLRIALKENDFMLQEVQITALGIKRDKKALGYAIGEVSGSELEKAKEINVINALSGKIPGLVINQTAGGPSGSSNVIIRGGTELTGNNQPLYVIDGIPLDNSNFANAGTWGGFDLGDGISSINPDDIETISVLKGPAASALYGSRASHGVILITTKKGRINKRLGIEFNTTTTFDQQLTKYNDLQASYGQGSNGRINGVNDEYSTNQSWGPNIDPGLSLNYFDGESRPYKYIPQNIDGFFETGFTTTNTIVFNSLKENSSTRLSYTNLYNKDIVPNTNMNRNSVNLRTVNNFGKKLDVDIKVNYVKEIVKNRPALSGYTGNVANNLITLATTFDQKWLEKSYKTPEGNYYDWNNGDIYNLNPYWIIYEMKNNSNKDKIMASALFKYTFNDKLYLQATGGGEINQLEFQEYTPPTTPNYETGYLRQRFFNNTSYNSEIILVFKDKKGMFDYGGIVGGNIFHVDNKSRDITAKNMTMRSTVALQSFTMKETSEDTYRKQINSGFAMGNVALKDYLFLDATLRIDKSSTLPLNYNIYTYYSASTSLLLSEMFHFNKKTIPYAKMRFSYAKVGSDTEPYQLSLLYQLTDKTYEGYTTGNIFTPIVPNPYLKPAMTNSYEAGIDFRFLDNRLGLDFTYYSQVSKNQIMNLAVSTTSGYGKSLVNAGEITNKGIEIALKTRPVKTGDFSWDLDFNFSKNDNKVVELAPGINHIELQAAAWQGVVVAAVEGEQYGAILGRDFKRNENGDVIVNATSGLPEITEDLQVLGNASWDWTGGISTSLTYKNFTLSTLIDVKVGADLYSMTSVKLARAGKSNFTLEGRDAWYESEEKRLQEGVREVVWTPTGGYITKGVVEQSDGTYSENTKAIDPQDYWEYVTNNIASPFIFDNSYVKVREITLSYQFPNHLINNFAESCTLSLVARNPFILYKGVENIDPESTYNNSYGMGMEYGSLPSRRSFGFNLNIKF
jgi:TonB-linked SusC/RagA family outer membrane protein